MDDMHSRLDCMLMMDRMGVAVDDYLYWNEFMSIMDRVDRQRVSIVLYDHNIPDPLYADRVTGIVDHHDDSGYLLSIQNRQIVRMGSACSLVSQYIHNNNIYIDDNIRECLSTVIRVDCFDFDRNVMGSRWMQMDREQYELLIGDRDIDSLYQRVIDSKFNL